MVQNKLSKVVAAIMAAFLQVVVIAQAPPRLNFEGQVTVDQQPFTGLGQFKFALLTTPDSVVWTSRPDSDRDGIPDAPVFVPVTEGAYNIDFVSPLPPIGEEVFNYDLRMRVWFRPDELHEFQLVSPDQRFLAAPFAFRSRSAEKADNAERSKWAETADNAFRSHSAEFATVANEIAGRVPSQRLIGTLDEGLIPANIARLNSSPVFTGPVQAPSFQGALDAANLKGLIPDGSIPAKIPQLVNGSLGVGTGSPRARLHVVEADLSGTFNTALFESPSRAGTWLHLRNTSIAPSPQWSLGVLTGSTGFESGGFTIRDWDQEADRLTISPSGNVGIGVAHPDTTLALKRDNANPAFGGYCLSLNDRDGTPWWRLGASDKGVFSIGAAGLRDYDISIDRASGRVGIGGIPDTSSKLRVAGDVLAIGIVQAPSFQGSLHATNLTGTIPIERVPENVARLNSSPVFAGPVHAPFFLGRLDAANLNGPIPDGSIPANLARLNSSPVFTGPVQAPSFKGALDATNLTGTIPIERIPANLARLDSSPAFSGSVRAHSALFESDKSREGTGLHLRATKDGYWDPWSGISVSAETKQWSIAVPGSGRLGADPRFGSLVIRDSTKATDRLTISTSGNVGIGVEHPDTTLALKRDNANPAFGGYCLSLNDRDGTPWWKLGASDKGVFSIGAAGLRDYDISIDRASGRVGIGGIPDTSSKLRVAGDVRVNGTVYQSSDVRLKDHIQPIQNALKKVTSLRGVTFDWRDAEANPGRTAHRQAGFIAQQVEAVIPELVRSDSDGYLAVNYNGMAPVLVEAIKSLDEKYSDALNEKDRRIQQMEARLKTLEAALRK